MSRVSCKHIEPGWFHDSRYGSRRHGNSNTVGDMNKNEK